MSKKKVVIGFKNIHQLWNYSQRISATNLEIVTTTMILTCICSDEDLALLPQYGGKVIEKPGPIDDTYVSN
ncbi:MAG: hypothetical protein ACXVBZ_13960 [Flavisolibacter sp.]